MSLAHWPELENERVDPKRFGVLLERNGWAPRGGRPGLYSRWVLEADQDQRLIIPLDEGRADYDELLREALAVLASMSAEHAAGADRVLRGLIKTPGDEIRFKKEATTFRGGVSWPTGEELVISSRNALLAAAKSRVVKLPYYGNRAGRFAHRYLESVLMGQTEMGSYVVVAYAPVDDVFHEKQHDQRSLFHNRVGAHTGREITEALGSALEATQEAIDHYQATSSLSAFDDGIQRGVSKELAEAVKGMVQDADGAKVVIRFLSEAEVGAVEPSDLERSFEFSAEVRPILDQAIDRLSALDIPERVTVVGWGTIVEKPKPGGRAILRLRVISGSPARTVRVQLTREQYDIAYEAQSNDQLLSVTGQQHRDGRMYWLLDISDLSAVDATVVSSRAAGDDQLDLYAGDV